METMLRHMIVECRTLRLMLNNENMETKKGIYLLRIQKIEDILSEMLPEKPQDYDPEIGKL